MASPDFGIEGLELLIDTFKILSKNFLTRNKKKVTEDCIILDNINALTQGLDSLVQPMVRHFLELFRAHAMRNVLEKDISVVLSKNDFVTMILKSLKTKKFMKEEKFDYSLQDILRGIKERSRLIKYNK